MNAPLRSTDLAKAREDIADALMSAGCWPVPKPGRPLRVELDFASYLGSLDFDEQDAYANASARVVFNAGLPETGDLANDLRREHEPRIKAWIPERIVLERAAELAEQAAEDAETEREYQRMYPEVS